MNGRESYPHENLSNPWSPSSSTELVLDALTLGVARKYRERKIRAHYANWDETRFSSEFFTPVAAPRHLSDVRPGMESSAQLALRVAANVKLIHIETFQGFGATLINSGTGGRRASASYSNNHLHMPTVQRIREATGKDYARDLRNAGTLAVLRTLDEPVDIEGLGPLAHEYFRKDSKTGRVTDANFLIRGLPSDIAGQLIEALQEQPAETLDGIVYTAFADMNPPGRSLLQAPQDSQESESLFIPKACQTVEVASVTLL